MNLLLIIILLSEQKYITASLKHYRLDPKQNQKQTKLFPNKNV